MARELNVSVGTICKYAPTRFRLEATKIAELHAMRARGLTLRQIAAESQVSYTTVAHHVGGELQRLREENARLRAELDAHTREKPDVLKPASAS